MLSLPYAPRRGQDQLISDIRSVQRTGSQLVIEGGTGLGKTICGLVGSLHTDRKLIYATRTNSQQDQVLQERLQLSDQTDQLILPFQGRKHYCPHLMGDERYREGTAEELGKLCRDAKRKAQSEFDTGKSQDGCPYFLRLLEDGPEPVEAILRGGVASASQLSEQVTRAGSCPYESLKQLMGRADGVVVPYIFLLDDQLRQTLLDWLGATAQDVNVIIDEAHNLPDAARNHHSPSLGPTSLLRARREAERAQDPTLAGIILATSLITEIEGALQDLSHQYVQEEDGLLPPGEFLEALMVRLRQASPTLRRIALDLMHWGQAISDEAQAAGKLPRSYLGSLGKFLTFWLDLQDGPFVQLVDTEQRLEAYLLDPSYALGWLHEFWSVTHMSGTLTPLEDYAALCGIQQAKQVELPSPFPPEKLQVFAVEAVDRRHLTLQQQPELVSQHQAMARLCLQQFPGRVAIFFTSHKNAQAYLEEGFLHGIDRPLFVEEAGMTSGSLMALVYRFKASPGGILIAVMGGRITEGIDFPGNALDAVVIMGVPYPRPSAKQEALLQYFDARHGQGWNYVVHNPVGRVLRQAVGRLIRSESDTGTAIVLDERARRFHAFLPGLQMVPGLEPWPITQSMDFQSGNAF